MKTIIVGLGRYGRGLVGQKYIDGKFKTKLVGGIDPRKAEIENEERNIFKDTPLYTSINELQKDILNNM